MLVLLAWFLWPFVVHGARFPLGPDGPVYLWWTRLAGLDGLSAVGHRPGASALALVLMGVWRTDVVQATAALEVTLAVSIGLAGAAILRPRSSGTGAWLGGLLAGTFAVHLAAGYLANLAFVPCFLVAIALLDSDRRRASVLAAFALGAGGLAHPSFFLLGAVVLLIAAAGAMRSNPDESRRLVGATLGGGAILGIGLLGLLAGPRPPQVDTSKDAFLRRAGLAEELRSAYRERLLLRWPRYVPWLSVPLAVVGSSEPEGIAGRILRSWLWVTIAGVVIAFVSGWLPPDRFVTFGFAIPILAALGLERVRRGLGTRRLLAWAIVGGATLVMLAGPAIVWSRQEPFMTEDEVRAAAIGGQATPEGPLVFAIDEPGATVAFLAPRAANVIRASVPPDRIRDVVILVPPGGTSDPVRRSLEELTSADRLRAGARAGDGVIALTPFVDPTVSNLGAPVLIIDPARPGAAALPDLLAPASALAIGLTSVGALLLLGVVGFGWSRIGFDDPSMAVAASPALGGAALILVAVALDLVGVGIGTTAGAIAVSALAGGGGYILRYVLQRRAGTGAPPQIEQEPAE